MSSPDTMESRNRWKRVSYTALAPIYNLLARPLDQMRRESIKRLALQPGERVLVVGAGTGLDLDYLPQGVNITAIDLTPAMLDRLRRRAERLGLVVDARVMNAHALEFPDGSFDAVILHLILAVIPDPVRCASEAARVLRPGGRAVVMDKFVPDDRPTPALLKAINPILDFLGTSVNRKLGPILAGSGLRIVSNDAAGLGGYYRIVLARKDRSSSHRAERPSVGSVPSAGGG